MANIPSGIFLPPFIPDSVTQRFQVPPFQMEIFPVTKAQFANFVQRHPEWKRTGKKNLFNDANYLSDWLTDSIAFQKIGNQPATYVSWHAAKAYCADLGRRLPTIAEWESVAATREKGSDSLAQLQKILDWYGRPSSLGIDTVGSGTRHAYGIRDMHALIWEWTSDYRSWGYAQFATGKSEDSARFCGAAGNRKNSGDYIVYMRYGFRSSLEPHFAVAALGFRCAADSLPRSH